MRLARSLCTASLLLAVGCGGSDPAPGPAPPYWIPVEDFFSGEIGWEATREHPERAVEMRSISPLPFLETGGYDLPFLQMAPPAEVRLSIPADGGPLRFEAFTGAAEAVGAEASRAVRFEVLVDGELAAAVTRTWQPDMPLDERQWQPLPPVEIPPGGELLLRTALPAADAGSEAFRVGFGRPRLLRSATRPAPAGTAPNVVFVLMDTLRSDKLSVYGNERDLTPNLQALAARGTVFESAWSTASWTWPSTVSLLTGLLPEEHGVVSQHESYLHGRARTLPEILREAGYTTGGFSTNPLIDVCHNYDQGFDDFRDPTWVFDPTSAVAADVRAWLRTNADRRFFLYLHLVDPHVPYDPLPRFAGQGSRAPVLDRPRLPMEMREHLVEAMEQAHRDGQPYDPLEHVDGAVVRALEREYERCVQTADHWVGEFLAELDALGLSENTIVVFTSDHGEEFLDHGLLAHASSLHRELMCVPLIAAGPGWPAGVRVATPVSNRHLAPTLLRLVDADATQLGDEDALDLAALAELPERPVYFSTHTGIWKGRKGTPVFGMLAADHLVHVYEVPREDEDSALDSRWDTRVYDLSQDPGAVVDVSERDPRKTETLRAMVLERLERSRERFASGGPVQTVGAGEAGTELLRQIGYIGDDE